MKVVEIEVRSFISKDEYSRLKEYFNKNAKLIKKDNQETHYLNTVGDLRIQKNNAGSKIWYKKGSIHDKWREEIEIKFSDNDFSKLKDIFNEINLKTKIIWFRKRTEYMWSGIKVDLDYTKGYGYIIELEKKGKQSEAEEIYQNLLERLTSLGIKVSSKKEFDDKFNYYQENWKKLI